MITSEDWLVVPVKCFSLAKRRLEPPLDASGRKLLARAMLTDVLLAATNVRDLSNIAIVTASDEVARFADEWRVSLIDDGGAGGLNEALQVALMTLSRSGAKAVAVVPSDVPLVQAKDIRELLMAAREHDVALAPASHDSGTNGLALSSPLLMTPRFGINSFLRHLEAAHSLGISPSVLRNIRFGLDLDEPARLSEFINIGAGTHASRYLSTLSERIAVA